MPEKFLFELQVHAEGKLQLTEAHDILSAISKHFREIVKISERIIGPDFKIEIYNVNTKVDFLSLYEIMISSTPQMEERKLLYCNALYELLMDFIDAKENDDDTLFKTKISEFFKKLNRLGVENVDADYYRHIKQNSFLIIKIIHKSNFKITVNRLWVTKEEPVEQLVSVKSSNDVKHIDISEKNEEVGVVEDLFHPRSLVSQDENIRKLDEPGVNIVPVRLYESREMLDISIGLKYEAKTNRYYLYFYSNKTRQNLLFKRGAEMDLYEFAKKRLSGTFRVQVDANALPSKPMEVFSFATQPSES